MNCVITSLHAGMNLRDEPIVMQEGETGVTVGVDVSQYGKIKPLKESLHVTSFERIIQYMQICYVGTTQYIFTTHSDGLYVTYNNSTKKLNSYFKGVFKALTVNNSWVALMNDKYCRKWIPGKEGLYDWGLPTPEKPTIAAYDLEKVLLNCFSGTPTWAKSGGGSSGSVAIDSTKYHNGSWSLKLICSANETLLATNSLDMDMTTIVSEGDITDKSFLRFYLYTEDLTAVDGMKIMFSVESSGSFEKNYYEYQLKLGGFAYATLSSAYGESSPIISKELESYKVSGDGKIVKQEYDPQKKTIKVYVQTVDNIPSGEDIFDTQVQVTEKIIEHPIEVYEFDINAVDRKTFIGSKTWSEIVIPLRDFIRYGDSEASWEAIKATRISLTALDKEAVVWVADMELCGTGNFWGYYRVACAYQNELGNYGAYSPFSNEIMAKGQALKLTLPVSSDKQVTARRLVILGGSLTEPMVYTIQNNTDQDLKLNISESSFQEIEVNFNNFPPVPGKDFEVAFGRVWIAGPKGYTNRLSFSEAGFYEGFPKKNYKEVDPGDQIKQVKALEQHIAIRGVKREYRLYFLGNNYTTWRMSKGSRQGTMNSQFMLNLGKAHVYATHNMLYMSGEGVEGEYLPKLTKAIKQFDDIRGDNILNKGYIYYKDINDIDRVLLINYTFDKVVATYLMNIKPSAIVADHVKGCVYYALNKGIYIFEKGLDYLPVDITIPMQYCGSKNQKTFGPLLYYDLWGNNLQMQFKVDRQDVNGQYTLPVTAGNNEPVSIPIMIGRGLEIRLQSSGGNFELYLPLEIEATDV